MIFSNKSDGFDENVFLFYEEDILAKKMKENGYKIYSINNAKVVHYESQTIGKVLNYYQKMKRKILRIKRKKTLQQQLP